MQSAGSMQSEGKKIQSAAGTTQLAGGNMQSEGGKKRSADDSMQSAESDTQTDDSMQSAESDTQTDVANATEQKTEQSEDPHMVWLRRYFAKSMGICFEPPPEHLLDEVNFEGVARYMASDRCKKIVVMTGAGISTSAGIPDFRSPGTGCYEQLKKEYNIENPQQLFEFSYFKDHPEPYYKYRKELWRCTYKPTPCHYFVRLLENKNKLLRHFTQNIDGLETMAGISKDKLIQAHGTMATAHCMECGQNYSQQWVRDKIYGPDGPVPRCAETECGGLVRPDIVMFGESLPDRFKEHIPDLDDCDLLLIMGTSLVVQPFANLSIRTKDNVPRLYINMENLRKTSNHPLSVLIFGGGFDFDKEDNIRDVFWQGKCDDGCYRLADLIGWGDEFRTLVKEEHARLNKELGITCDSATTNKTDVSSQKTVTSRSQKTTSCPEQRKGNGAVHKQGTDAVLKNVTGPVHKQGAGAVHKQGADAVHKQGADAVHKQGAGAVHKKGAGAAQKSENRQSQGQPQRLSNSGMQKLPQKPISKEYTKPAAREKLTVGETVKQTSATKGAIPHSQRDVTNSRK